MKKKVEKAIKKIKEEYIKLIDERSYLLQNSWQYPTSLYEMKKQKIDSKIANIENKIKKEIKNIKNREFTN